MPTCLIKFTRILHFEWFWSLHFGTLFVNSFVFFVRSLARYECRTPLIKPVISFESDLHARQAFAKVFASCSRLSDSFGLVRTCSDACERIRMHFGALGCVRMLPEIFGFSEKFWTILNFFWHLLTLGAYYHTEMRVERLIVSGG